MDWNVGFENAMRDLGYESPYACPACKKNCKGTFRLIFHYRFTHIGRY